jgi:hypothetical protein
VLSTEAGVVRVTSVGKKECEGATDSAGDGLTLDGVHPNYTLGTIRESGWEPQVTGHGLLLRRPPGGLHLGRRREPAEQRSRR